MAAIASLMTVEEFQKLPEDDGPVIHELRNGELVEVSRPKFGHVRLQKHLEKLLAAAAGNAGEVVTEFPFRPLPEHEFRTADLAFISMDRWRRTDRSGDFHGAPEMVIEILSPSNTVAEMDEREKLCLENGSQQFWVINMERCQIKISTPDGRTVTYRSGQEIPLLLFGNAVLAIDLIFE